MYKIPKCPEPTYKQCKVGDSFHGIIVSLLSPNQGLFYVLPAKWFSSFQLVKDFQPTEKYLEPPAFGETFLYKKGDSTYRAFRINSNPAAITSISMFLYDIGQRIDIDFNFRASHYFKMPSNFSLLEPLGFFCCLESFPPVNAMRLKSDFLNCWLHKSVLFTIVRKDVKDNAVRKSRRCLVVNAMTTIGEESGEAGDETLQEEVPNDNGGLMKPKKIYPRLRYLGESLGRFTPFKVGRIARDATLPEPGSKVMIYHCHTVSIETFNARIIKQADIGICRLPTDQMALYRWMNNRSTVESYQKLPAVPEVGDMVIGFGRNSQYNRGLVVAADDLSCEVLFVDNGTTQSIEWNKLYKFPKEFSLLPFQAVKIIIANMCPCVDEKIQAEIMQIIDSELESQAFAEVVSSRRTDHLVELTVKLYSGLSGEDIVDIVRERINHQ